MNIVINVIKVLAAIVVIVIAIHFDRYLTLNTICGHELEQDETSENFTHEAVPVSKETICKQLAYDPQCSALDPTKFLPLLKYEEVVPCWPSSVGEIERNEEFIVYLQKEQSLREKKLKEVREAIQFQNEIEELMAQWQIELKNLRHSDQDAYLIVADINLLDKSDEEDKSLRALLATHPLAVKLIKIQDRLHAIDEIVDTYNPEKNFQEQVLFREDFISTVMRNK